MSRPTRARIDLAAVKENFTSLVRAVSRRTGDPAPGPRVIAVVKANAYGHGAVPVARALEAAGVAMLACADIEEGVSLREAGVRVPILVFGALSVSDLDGVFSHGLTPTVSTPGAARALGEAAVRRGVRVACHLKIDTGMHRLGFRDDNLRRTLPAVAATTGLRVDAVYTHFATADDPEHALFGEQRMRFDRAVAELARIGIEPAFRHAANSAALLRDERVWYDFVRPGLLLYGVVPFPLSTTIPLRPAMSLSSRVVAVKGLRPGEASGYGAGFVAAQPTTLAVVPAGYADGLDLRLAGRGSVLIRGTRAPIVGAVSMDMLSVDVTGTDVNPGDEVVMLGTQNGERIDVRETAAAIGTTSYEILCRLGSRIERVYNGALP